MFPSCAYILQKEYVSLVKSSQYDYWFRETLGRWIRGWMSVGWWAGGPWILFNGKNMFGLVIILLF